MCIVRSSTGWARTAYIAFNDYYRMRSELQFGTRHDRGIRLETHAIRLCTGILTIGAPKRRMRSGKVVWSVVVCVCACLIASLCLRPYVVSIPSSLTICGCLSACSRLSVDVACGSDRQSDMVCR